MMPVGTLRPEQVRTIAISHIRNFAGDTESFKCAQTSCLACLNNAPEGAEVHAGPVTARRALHGIFTCGNTCPSPRKRIFGVDVRLSRSAGWQDPH